MKTTLLIFLLYLNVFCFCYGQSKKAIVTDKKITTTSQFSHEFSQVQKDVLELKKQNTELLQLMQQQNKQAQILVSDINASKPGVLELWIYPIVLSVIAAIIFWFAFSFFPENKRKKELRPKIEAELSALKLQLFFFIDTVMYIGKHYGSLSQHKINSASLTEAEIQLALHSKCLNENYLYDPVVSHLLIPIGEKLYEGAKKMDEQIEHLFTFSALLSSREILLLENIRQTSQVYDFSDPINTKPGVEIGGQTLLPVYPSMTYRSENFFKCLTLYTELQEIMHNTVYGKNNLAYEIVSKLYYQGQYKQCQKVLRREYKEKASAQTFWILSEFMGGDKAKSYELLKAELLREGRLEMVSNRFLYKEFINDSKAMMILNEHSKPGEMAMFLRTVKEEEDLMQNFIDSCNFIKKYYQWKGDNYRSGKVYNPNETTEVRVQDLS